MYSHNIFIRGKCGKCIIIYIMTVALLSHLLSTLLPLPLLLTSLSSLLLPSLFFSLFVLFYMILIIRKLSVHDIFSQIAVHVAMDMLVVVEDLSKSKKKSLVDTFTIELFDYAKVHGDVPEAVLLVLVLHSDFLSHLHAHLYTCICTWCTCAERLCREPHEIPGNIKVTNEQGEPISSLRLRRSVSDVSETHGHQPSERAAAFYGSSLETIHETPHLPAHHKRVSLRSKTDPSCALSDKQGTGTTVGRLATITRQSSLKKSLNSALNATKEMNFSESMDYLKLSITSTISSDSNEAVVGSPDSQPEFETLLEPNAIPPSSDTLIIEKEEELTAGVAEEGSEHLGYFRPLLLFIPLRLGQDCFNMEYAVALKVRGDSKVFVLQLNLRMAVTL